MTDRIQTLTINSTADQTKTALVWMKKLIQAAKVDPAIVELARTIIWSGTQNLRDEAEAVRQWIFTNVKYVSDPAEIQYLQAPAETLRLMSGNCDCMATLAGSLLAAVGHEVEPLGVCWIGDVSPSHAVLFDVSAECIVDPVTELPCLSWPPADYVLDHFVSGW